MLNALENAFLHAPIGMALLDVDGTPLLVNQALCRITGFTAVEICAHSFRNLFAPSDLGLEIAEVVQVLERDISIYEVEKRFRHASGSLVWVLLSVSLTRDDDGVPVRLIAQVQDISERKGLEGRLEHLVDHDFLTGLYNARRFEQALAQETRTHDRYGGGGAVLLLDLDRFKEVNDQFGHKAGDDLLKTMGAEIRRQIRETDVVARLGGDEFGILLPQVDAQQAEVVARGIVKAVRRQTAMLGEHHIALTASVGIALIGALPHGELMAAADLAMYEAKEAGRDRFVLYRSVTDAEPRRSSRLAEAERIQQALAHDQFELFCQPILDLATNQITQYELLLRLRTKAGDLLPPSAFMYVAERFGTILSIDAWVVRRAVELIAAHAKRGRPLTLNVNISAKSIGSSHLPAIIDRALEASDVDPARLVFELTETAAIGNIEQAKTFTSEMKKRGCRFALDDFGSGFGSFFYLKHLPFDYFKIDGDFIRGFGGNPTDELVVQAIVNIAKGMGKKTVAECVTDEAMIERLRRSGVDYAQGFHVGPPRPVREALDDAMSA
jgi:diguanylate cyclase (GGDEF)-like protein/PAS domain S-box-containing protein